MNKLPAFQFYPADWRKDPAVQAMSFYDRGVWFEILCLMHESEQRGKLMLSGKPMPDEVLARLLGVSKSKLLKSLNVILDYGVASRDHQGVLVNRRMVRDEEIRKIRAEAGKKGGNPTLLNQNPAIEDKQKTTPSSSSSSSSSEELRTTHTPPARDASSFVQAYLDAFPSESLSQFQRDQISGRVRDGTRWKQTIEFWLSNKHIAKNVGNMLRYYSELVEGKQNGTNQRISNNGRGKATPAETIASRPYYSADLARENAGDG